MDVNTDLKTGIVGSIASLLIAILSGLGVGSGGLFVIWLTMFEGVAAQDARGLNLLFFVFSAGAALVFHILRKRLRYRLVIFMAIFACIGTLAGSYIGARISSEYLRKFLGAMLAVSGVYTLVTRIWSAKGKRIKENTTKVAE